MNLSPDDVVRLSSAQQIARRGWGHVHPNPMVGCVLVREGRVVGEGYHAAYGGPHAEIVALEEALDSAVGAIAYVSLEPCNHRGRTPPCAEALIEGGVSKVVYGAADPGGASGGGAEALRAAGIEVVGPAWSSDVARAENPAFFHTSVHESPFVALKLAMSMDAKISSAPGVSTRLTGAEAEREVHRLRSGFDAVMVGSGTVRTDDPRLTARLVAPGRVPTSRIILASTAAIPTDAALFEGAGAVPVHVFSRHDVSDADRKLLEASGAHVHSVAATPSGLALAEVFGSCWEVGIRSILCEGGERLAASLLRERRVHRVYLFVSPTTLGAGGVPAFPDDAGEWIWEDFRSAFPPIGYGADTLMVLDRQEG